MVRLSNIKISILSMGLLGTFLLTGCFKEIEPTLPLGDTKLVVEARLTNEAVTHFVKLSESQTFFDSALFTPNSTSPATEALVELVNDEGRIIRLFESEPGLYETQLLGFKGEVGKRYQLVIKTQDGKEYRSGFERMNPVPEIEAVEIEKVPLSINVEPPVFPNPVLNPILNGQPIQNNWAEIVNALFVPDIWEVLAVEDRLKGQPGFLIGWFNAADNAQLNDESEIMAGLLADLGYTQQDILSLANITIAPGLQPATQGYEIKIRSTDLPGERNYYKWNLKGTFAVDTNPQRFSRMGTNKQGALRFVFNQPKSCCDQCWLSFEFPSIHLFNDRLTDGKPFLAKTATIPINGFFFDQNFYLEVEQSSVSLGALKFFEAVNEQTLSNGSLFDSTPTTAISNISNVDNPDEQVLGYFTVSAVSTFKTFVGDPIDAALLDEFTYFDDCQTLANSLINASVEKPDFWPN